jgi:hypothetical protein
MILLPILQGCVELAMPDEADEAEAGAAGEGTVDPAAAANVDAAEGGAEDPVKVADGVEGMVREGGARLEYVPPSAGGGERSLSGLAGNDSACLCTSAAFELAESNSPRVTCTPLLPRELAGPLLASDSTLEPEPPLTARGEAAGTAVGVEAAAGKGTTASAAGGEGRGGRGEEDMGAESGASAIRRADQGGLKCCPARAGGVQRVPRSQVR